MPPCPDSPDTPDWWAAFKAQARYRQSRYLLTLLKAAR